MASYCSKWVGSKTHFFENLIFFLNQELTVVQIKETKSMIDEQMKINDAELIKHEQERNEALKEVSNHLHESCIISNDEVQGGLIVEKKKW